MTALFHNSQTTLYPRNSVDVLPTLAETRAQLIAFEMRNRVGDVRGQRMSTTPASLLLGVVFLAIGTLTSPVAMAQPAASAPPAVGVVTVERQPMTDSYEFNGRIQPINSVNIVARVTAWLDKQHFVEGTDVKKGDLLYTLEKAPFQAAVDRQKAAVAQAEAQLANADIDLRRAQQLVQTNAGTQQRLDNAQASQRVAVAQLKAAQAQLETAQITLDYTDITSPVEVRL